MKTILCSTFFHFSPQDVKKSKRNSYSVTSIIIYEGECTFPYQEATQLYSALLCLFRGAVNIISVSLHHLLRNE